MTKQTLLIISCTLLFSLMSTPVLAADYFRWQDEHGKWHFTDRPPKGIQYELFKARSSVRNKTSLNTQTIKEEPRNSQLCEREKERLNVLQTNTIIRIKNDDGTLRDLEAHEIEKEVLLAQQAVNVYCTLNK